MLKREISDLWGLLNELNASKEESTFKFKYGISRNLKILEPQIKKLEEEARLLELPELDEKFTEYEKKRIELCETFAEKDEEGKPVKEPKKDDNGNVIDMVFKIEDTEEFNNKYKELVEANKETVEKEEERRKTIQGLYNELLDENVDVDLYKIAVDEFPNYLSQIQVNFLMDKIVKE